MVLPAGCDGQGLRDFSGAAGFRGGGTGGFLFSGGKAGPGIGFARAGKGMVSFDSAK